MLEGRGGIHHYNFTSCTCSQAARCQLLQLQDLPPIGGCLTTVVEQPTTLKATEKWKQAEGSLGADGGNLGIAQALQPQPEAKLGNNGVLAVTVKMIPGIGKGLLSRR